MLLKKTIQLLYSVFVIASAAIAPLKAQENVVNHSVLFIKDYGLKEYIYLSKDLPHSENNSWKLVCQMPYNCQFQPWIRIKSLEGKVIHLNSSDPLVLYLTKTEMVTAKKGVNIYEAKNWISGEAAIYTRDIKVKQNGTDSMYHWSIYELTVLNDYK